MATFDLIDIEWIDTDINDPSVRDQSAYVYDPTTSPDVNPTSVPPPSADEQSSIENIPNTDTGYIGGSENNYWEWTTASPNNGEASIQSNQLCISLFDLRGTDNVDNVTLLLNSYIGRHIQIFDQTADSLVVTSEVVSAHLDNSTLCLTLITPSFTIEDQHWVSFKVIDPEIEQPATPLAVQPPRNLSPLELEAFNLIFAGTVQPDLLVEVHAKPIAGFGSYTAINPFYNRENNEININVKHFPFTDNITIDSTLLNTDIFSPANLFYLQTFIHEATHHWQHHQSGVKRFDKLVFPLNYYITEEQVRSLSLDKEEHAVAVSVYFVIKWQLEHRPPNELIDVSNLAGGTNKGIRALGFYDILRNISIDANGKKLITRLEAEQILLAFAPVISDLQSTGG